jgi:hypothetical protein
VKGGNPTELMMAATGEGNTICALYVPQHPLYWEKRRLFRTREAREREERRVAKKRRVVTSVNTDIATLRKAASEEAARLVRLCRASHHTRHRQSLHAAGRNSARLELHARRRCLAQGGAQN